MIIELPLQKERQQLVEFRIVDKGGKIADQGVPTIKDGGVKMVQNKKMKTKMVQQDVYFKAEIELVGVKNVLGQNEWVSFRTDTNKHSILTKKHKAKKEYIQILQV